MKSGFLLDLSTLIFHKQQPPHPGCALSHHEEAHDQLIQLPGEDQKSPPEKGHHPSVDNWRGKKKKKRRHGYLKSARTSVIKPLSETVTELAS